MESQQLYMILGGGVFIFMLLFLGALSGNAADLERRLARVGPQGNVKKLGDRRVQNALRSTTDSGIPLLNFVVQFMPNPDKLRNRLGRTGRNISLGEYFLMNALSVLLFFMLFHFLHWSKMIGMPLALALGAGIPHIVTGIMGARRIKKFLAYFPEAIDTMCRGIRSGLPVTESIASVGREMPDPVGVEFHRISDGVRMGKSLESSMWEVTRRVDTPEFRFLIIAMAIQKETGGNLAETLSNLSELIRRRRQLKLKIKAMSSEAKASAMIIGSLPFIMFTLLMLVNADYMLTLFRDLRGKIMIGAAGFWMAMGWAVMTKMIHFDF